MQIDIYMDLCRHLNTYPIGAPASDEIIEILRMKFTPEEAQLALFLHLIPQTVAHIAESSKKGPSNVRKLLEEMADKGLVMRTQIPTEEETQDFYVLLPTIPGLFETSFGKGECDEKSKKLANLWQDYYTSGFGREVHGANTPLTRVMPIEDAVTNIPTEVLPHEKAAAFLQKVNFFSVTHCACRHSASLSEKSCGLETEVCMHFEDFGRFLVERGYAKEITRKKALQILKRTQESGMVHLTTNFKDECLVICSCCPCCCFQLKGILQLGSRGAVASSRFLPVVDPDTCTACEACEDLCHVNAMHVAGDTAVVEEKNCIGCGLCITACPVDAVSLMERPSYPKPLSDFENLATQILTEKAPIRNKP